MKSITNSYILKAMIILPLSLIFFSDNIYSLSATAKSQEDYIFTLSLLREVKIMVENFPGNEKPATEDPAKQNDDGQDAVKNKYAEIQQKFQKAGETYYSQDFSNSYNQFKNLKLELIALLENLSKNYMQRTKEILDSVSKESFDVLIQYSKSSGLATYFRKPFDPLYDSKPYNPKNYHLFHNKQRIETYLKNGYKKYNDAMNQLNDPEIKILLKKRNIPSKHLNYIIQKYMNVISLCREAKQLGIEIYKIDITTYPIEEPQKKPERTHSLGQFVDPIYDQRIPDKYKVDANDNIKLIHSIELMKIKNGKK